jgi:hypothetical protein
MRVLFIDFDGCLHPGELKNSSDAAEVEHCVHFGWLPHLERVLRPHDDVGVVVHSTWRYTHTPEELAMLLGPLESRFLGAVPRGPRWECIEWWLHWNQQVTDFRVLDDQLDEFPDPPPSQLILCNPHRGVSDPAVLEQLAQWLRGEYQPGLVRPGSDEP